MKWEITFTARWDEAERLAAEGWEFVTTSITPIQIGSIGFNTDTWYYFKRPLDH